jgi:hypothetical protein
MARKIDFADEAYRLHRTVTAVGGEFDELQTAASNLNQITDSETEGDCSEWSREIIEGVQKSIGSSLFALEEKINRASNALDEAQYELEDLTTELRDAQQMDARNSMLEVLHELDGRMMTAENPGVILQWVRDTLNELTLATTDDPTLFNSMVRSLVLR